MSERATDESAASSHEDEQPHGEGGSGEGRSGEERRDDEGEPHGEGRYDEQEPDGEARYDPDGEDEDHEPADEEDEDDEESRSEARRRSPLKTAVPVGLGMVALVIYFIWLFREMSVASLGGMTLPGAIFGAVVLGVLAGALSLLFGRHSSSRF